MSHALFAPELPVHPTLRHPRTGHPLRAVGIVGGRPVWPIIGASPDDPSDNPGSGDPQPPARPDGVSEEEWTALGDPGRAALVREREARSAAERALAASRATPTPPRRDPPSPGDKPSDKPKPDDKAKPGDVDVESIVQRAVEAAVKPFQEAEERREAETYAERVRETVLDAAKSRLHDATDAVAYIDFAQVLDGNGQADSAKVTAAIDDLLKRKPHLGKVVDDRRFAPDDAGANPGGSTRPLNDRVKDTLSRMQERAGVKLADF